MTTVVVAGVGCVGLAAPAGAAFLFHDRGDVRLRGDEVVEVVEVAHEAAFLFRLDFADASASPAK
jgi:hypothetical protein